MINHSENNIIQRKKVIGMLGWLGIPKKLRKKAISLMIDKKLIEAVNRDRVRIINKKKSDVVKKNIYELIWGDMFE